jgi:hypothetical protein
VDTNACKTHQSIVGKIQMLAANSRIKIGFAIIIAEFIFCAIAFSQQSQKEIIYMNGKAIAIETSNGSFASVFTPQSLSVKYLAKNQIKVQWCTGAYYAASFEIEKIPGGTIKLDGGQGCLSWTDTNVSSGTIYAYRIRAKNALGNAGAYSNLDIATAMTFFNNPMLAGNATLKSLHFPEQRQQVTYVQEIREKVR